MPESLAIVGASSRAAAASAARAGFQPVTADLFADADLRRIATATRISPYPQGLLDWLRAIEPAAWMYTGALENHPKLVDEMAWIAPLWGNPGDVLARVRSPWELAESLAAADLSFPEIRSSPDGLPCDGTWLAKSYRGAGGSGVAAWGRKRQGDTGAGRQLGAARSLDLVYQRRIAGTPCAAVFVGADGAARLLGLTRQLVGEGWLGAREFQYAGSIAPYPATRETLAQIGQIGNVLASQFQLAGLFGVDLVIDAATQRVWALEVNPRYTASVEIVERATGVAAIEAHAVACGSFTNGLTLRATRLGTHDHGKAILFAKRPVVVGQMFATWALDEATRLPWPMLADVPPAGARIGIGRPVLTLFAAGEDSDDVERRLRKRVAEVETRLYVE